MTATMIQPIKTLGLPNEMCDQDVYFCTISQSLQAVVYPCYNKSFYRVVFKNPTNNRILKWATAECPLTALTTIHHFITHRFTPRGNDHD